MTDKEMIILCAHTMGLTVLDKEGDSPFLICTEDGTGRCQFIYNPLSFDEQAYALLKKRKLWVTTFGKEHRILREFTNYDGMGLVLGPSYDVGDTDLNRAIVKCAAQIQQDIISGVLKRNFLDD